MNNRKGVEIMPIHKIEDDMYHKYDIVVSEILAEIINLSAEKKTIRLLNFNRKDKNHLLVLRIALMARDIYQFPVEVDCNWRDRLALNWKIRKRFKKINKAPDFYTNGVWVHHVLDLVKIKTNFAFDFSDIYETYYEGSLN
jgi:hypothetical protein